MESEMDKIASLTPKERSELFRQTAAEMDIHSAIVEKDFWVCWTLKHIFKHPELGNKMIFKGGTTLSKVYGVIERFSEDIDVSISRKLLGFVGKLDPAHPGLSANKRQKLLDEMSETCSEYVRTTLKQKLEKDFSLIINRSSGIWELTIEEEDPDQQTLLFKYPSHEEGIDYIQRFVRIEAGCRSDSWPTEQAVIKPFCTEYFPDIFDNERCPVTDLAVTRTFWEKATILHQEYHRPTDKQLPPRYSRHYYDVAMLARSKYKATALNDLGLLKHVVKHKKYFFRCGWANYDSAMPGSLRLSPAEAHLPKLRKDYADMKVMFFGEFTEFDDVLFRIKKLEIEINNLK
jgi:hypothetical protein